MKMGKVTAYRTEVMGYQPISHSQAFLQESSFYRYDIKFSKSAKIEATLHCYS